MANTRVNIDVSINTSAAARNLRQLQAQINSFQSALNTNNRLQGDAAKFYSQQLRDLANQSGFFNAETIKMRTAASELDQTLSKGQGTMRQFISARFLKDSAAAAQVLSLANARAAALETQFVSTGAAAGGFREAIAIRPLQAFNSATSVATQKLAIHRAMLLQATTSMINFGKNTQWAGRQLMVGFTVPLTIFGGIAGKVFKEIETELVNFKKVYGDAFTPPEELESNIEAVKDLAKEYTKYGIAVKDTIGLAAKAAATGAQNADLIDATRESTRLATLGQMEQNEALETTIALQTAFNISGEELGRTINFLNMVENQTVVTLQDLAAAIPRVAPVIKGLGGSVEDMAVMLAAMREGGVTAAQGANALKSGLASLINPSNKAVEALGKVGINLNAIVQANRGDLMGTVQAFAQALATLDEFGQQQALEKVFGKFQYARLGALFKNIVKDGSQASRVMDTATMSAQELAASAEKELGAIEQATSVKFTAAMEKLKLSIAPIGEMFMKIAIPIINFFTQLAEKFNNLPDMAKKFAAFGAIMIGLVIPAGTMFLGLLMNLIGTLIKFGSIVGIAFKGFVTGGIRGAIESVSQALNYMSLAELDASNASRQLGTSTEIVNAALRDQVPAAAGADAAIDNLSRSYAVLIAQMQQAAALSKVAFVGPGAAMAGAAATGAEAGSRSNPRGPRLRRNMGGTIPGSGNTDTVPAMLTPGEFVINKEATAKNLPLLHSINQGENIPGFNKGGQIPGMQYFAAKNKIRVVQDLMDSPPTPQELYAQDTATFAGMFGTSRTRSAKPNTQRKINAAKMESEDVYRSLIAQYEEGFETAKVSALRIAVEKLGISPKDLGLSTRGNYTFRMSPDSNADMMRGTLQRDRLIEDLSAPDVYDPLQRQIGSYFGTGLDKVSFDNILRSEFAMLPESGITNKLFEKASRNALTKYLNQAGFTREQRKSFTRDILAKDAVSANLSKPQLLQSLQQNGIPYRQGESKKDIYATIDGKEVNMGWLLGREVGSLGSRPQGILSFKSLSGSGQAVHANKGGMIPGLQYANRGMLIRNFQRLSGRSQRLLPGWLTGTGGGLQRNDRTRIMDASSSLGRKVEKEENLSGKFLQRGHVAKGIKIDDTKTYHPGLMIWQSPKINQGLKSGNSGKVTGKDIFDDLEKTAAHPFSLQLEAARRLGIPDTTSIPAINKSYEEARKTFGSIGDTVLKPEQFDDIFTDILKRNLPEELYNSLRMQGTSRSRSTGKSSGRYVMSESSQLNLGGMVSGPVQQMFLGGAVATAANAAKGRKGRVPGNVVDWFSKLTTSINQSSRDDLLQNIPANIKRGLSTSRKKFDITRGSIDPISGGSLKEVSSWSTGQGVGRFMESSRVFETLQNSKFQIAQRSQGMKRDIDLLKTLGPDGPPLGNPYNPFNRKDGGILNTNLTQKDIQEAGGSVWKANKKKVEERILRDQEFVSGHQKIIDDLQESYIPTIYRTSVRRGEKYFDVSDRIVPKDAQKLSNPAASTDILEEKEVALLGAKLSGTPKTRIVEKAEAQMRYDKASEEIKKLRMAIFRKEISAEEAKPMLQRLYDESENMASFVNWGRGREVSYPKVVSRLNMGGMVPGVQHLMAGALVKSKVATKTKAPTKAPLEPAQDWAMSGSDPDWDFSPAVMDFLSKRVKPTKSSSAEIKFLQKRGIDTRGMEASSMADRWNPKGKTAKDILETQYEVNVEEGIPLIAQALKRGATDEEMVASILAAQQWHSYAKSSPKELKEMFKTFSPSQIQDLTNGLMSLPENHQLRSTITGIFPEIKLMQEGIGGYKDADLQKAFFALSSMNKGGMIPGVQHLMAGAKVMPYVRPKKPAGPRATELEKEVMKKRAAASVAQDKTLDDLIFRRDKDGRLDLTPSELLVLLRENPNVSEKQFKEISKYHGSRIKTGMFGHFDKERGYRVVDQSAGTWRNISKVLEERGYPVVQKRNIGGKIFDSTKTSRTIVPGVGNTDTVPAMLTPGEFVINKDATNKNLDILHAINSGQPIGLNIGGKVPAIQNFSIGGGVDDWGAPIDNPFADLDTPATSQFDDWGAPVNQKKPSKLERFKSGVRSTARDVRMVGSDDFDETDTGKKINESRAGKYLNRRLSAGERAGAIMAKIAEMEFEQERTGIYDENLAKYADISEKKKYKERNLQTAERLVAQYDAKVSEWVAKGRPLPRAIPSSVDIDPSREGSSSNAMRQAPFEKGSVRWVFGYDSNGKEITDKYTADWMAQRKQLFDENKQVIPLEQFRDPNNVGTLKKVDLPREERSFVDSPAAKKYSRRNSILAGIALGLGIGGMGIAGYELGEDDEEKRIAYFNLGGKVFDSSNILSKIVPGVGNTDTVPAVLTPGEFVVNKDATSQNKRILEAINGGQEIKGYELGGIVEMGGGFGVEEADGSFKRFGTREEAQAHSSKVTGKRAGRRGGGAGKVLGGLGAGMALGTAGFFAGSAVGEKMGGETGAMVGGIAGSILPMLLPQTIKGIPTGGILPAGAMKGLAAKIGIGGAGKAAAAAGGGKAMAGVAVAAKGAAAALGGISAAVALPVAALVAAIVATTYTFYKMGKSNEAEYAIGKAYADAMTTSTEDIKAVGTSARERAKNLDQFLDQSESYNIQQEYAQKIAEAKTKAEKKALELERDKAVQARGTMTRGEAFETFYDKQIAEAKKQGASQDQMRRLYEQRNQALSVDGTQKLDFGFDKTFGSEFIKGAGKKDFGQFQMTKDFAKQVDIGQRSSAEMETMRRLSDAAYGITSSVENVAELDMASKLAQYVLSGAMSQDQASSIAEAVGAELGDLKIGQNIRTELAGLVGANGQFAKNRPGEVATELMERNKRRTQEMENITRQNISYLLAQTEENQTPGRTKKGQAFDSGNMAGFNIFTSFFAGMADEARRNIGSLIEIQVSEHQMLEENIAAVGLAYNDLIAKSKTLAEAERYRFERSREITKLQERRDELEQERSNMIFGSEENRMRLLKIGRERLGAVREAELETAGARQNAREIDPISATNFFPNLGERIGALWNLGVSNISNSFSRMAATIAGNVEEALPSSFAQIMTSQMKEAAFKKYEGTSTGAALTGLSELVPVSDPLYATMWQRILDDENYAMLVPAALANLEVLLKEGVETGNIGEEPGRAIADQLTDLLTLSDLPAETQARLAGVFSGLDIVQTGDLLGAFGEIGDIETQMNAYERFLPLMESLGDLSVIKFPSLGNKGIMESIIGNPEVLADLAENDKSLNLLMDFFTTMSELNPELQTRFVEQFDGIPAMIKFMKDAEKIKFPQIIGGFTSARKAMKNLSNVDMTSEELKEFDTYIFGLINRLNDIKDPEVKARLSAEIGPEVLTMMNLLERLKTETDTNIRQDIIDQIKDFSISANAGIDDAKKDSKKDKKPTGGGGGTKEDPLADIMRNLLATADLLSNIGTNLLSVDRKAKSIFDKLRDQDVNESVIGYLRSMGPEEAIEVGKELLGNQKKLNTIMQLAGEAAIASQQDATRVAQERAKFVKDLVKFKSLSGAPIMGLEAALGDEQFISNMSAARGTATPNKSMRTVQEEYFDEQQAKREALSAMAPTIVSSQIQQNVGQSYVSNQLASKGLSQEEISLAMKNEAIMAKIQDRLSKQLPIGPKIVDMVKNLYSSTKTTLSILDEGLSKLDNVFNFLGQSLEHATQMIDKFTIKPLQDQLDKIQDKNSELSEQQRRFSRSMSDLQEKENDLKEEQRKKEDAINESYDLRIESLEKVDKISKQIEDRQKGQLSVADALSRGDIGAAAKAAQEMQSKFAQAKRDEALQAMRDQKQEDIESIRKSHEEELKNLTILVNGELLTREQIQQKLDDIDQTLYNNSLLEYDIQRDINTQLKERKKIEEEIAKISLVRNAVSGLSQINQASSQEDKNFAIQSAKQGLQLLGGNDANNLISLIDKNLQALMSSDSSIFGQAMKEIVQGISPLATQLGTSIAGLGIQTPSTQAALDSAVTSANTELPNIFSGITTQIDNFTKSIDIDPESKDNPFAKIYKALKKVAAAIEPAFVAIKPKSKGGGGGGAGDGDDPGDGPKDGYKGNELGKSFRAGDSAESIKQQRENLRTKTHTQTIGKEKIRVTSYYDLDGNMVPGLTKYEAFDKKTLYAEGRKQKYSVPKEISKDSLYEGFEKTGLGFNPGYGGTMGNPARIDFAVAQQGGYLSQGSGKDKNKDPFQYAGDPVTAMVQVGAATWDGFISGFENAAKDGWNPVIVVLAAHVEAFKGFLGIRSPSTLFAEIGGNVAQGFLNGIVEKIKILPGTILSGFITGFKNLFGISSPSTEAIPLGTSVTEGFFEGIWNTIKTAPGRILSGFLSGIKTLFGIGEEGFSTKEGILGIGKSIVGGLFSGLMTAVQISPVGLLGLLVSNLAQTFGIGKADGPKQGGALGLGSDSTKSEIVGLGSSIMGGIFSGFIELINNPGKKISDIVDAVKTKLRTAFYDARADLGKIGENIWGFISSGLSGVVPDWAKEAAKKVGIEMKNKGGEIQKRAFGGKINYRGSNESAPGMMMGGSVKKFAFGSFVPGQGMTDKVPALLTPGEFVVRKSVAQAMIPQLKSINSQVYPGAGMDKQKPMTYSSSQFEKTKSLKLDNVRFGIPQNMNNSMQSTSNILTNSSSVNISPTSTNIGPTNVQYTYNVSVSAGSNASSDDIANMVMYKIKRFDDRKIKGTQIG